MMMGIWIEWLDDRKCKYRWNYITDFKSAMEELQVIDSSLTSAYFTQIDLATKSTR